MACSGNANALRDFTAGVPRSNGHLVLSMQGVCGLHIEAHASIWFRGPVLAVRLLA